MSDDLVAHLQDLCAPLGALTARRMFGGLGLYLDGVMIGVVMAGGVHFKVDAETKAHFAAAGSAPFVYEAGGKRITMGYWSVPESAMESAQAMLPWARLALEAARRKPMPRRRGR